MYDFLLDVVVDAFVLLDEVTKIAAFILTKFQ